MLLDLPEDVTLSILVDWLTLDNICCLDSAVCHGASRKVLLSLLSSEEFVHSGETGAPYNLVWLSRREMSINSLQVHCGYRSQVNSFKSYVENFGKVQGIEMRGFNDDAAFGYVDVSVHLMQTAAAHCEEIEMFSLDNCGLVIVDDGTKNIFDSHFMNLRKLSLTNCSISRGVFDVLFQNCKDLTMLHIGLSVFIERFVFTENGICWTSYSKAGNIQQSLSCFHNLTVLDISSTCKNDFVEPILVDLIANNPALTSLNLSNQLEINETLKSAISERCPNLRQFYLNHCINVDDASLVPVVNNFVKLSVLHVDSCTLLTKQSFTAIATSMKQLLELSVCRANIDTRSFFLISQNCVHLITINCSDCGRLGLVENNVENAAAAAVKMGVTPNTSLNNVSLSGCVNITDNFLTQLSKRAPKMEKLNISGCVLVSSEFIEAVRHRKIGTDTGQQGIRGQLIHQQQQQQQEGQRQQRDVDVIVSENSTLFGNLTGRLCGLYHMVAAKF